MREPSLKRDKGEPDDWVPRGVRCRDCGRVHYPPKRVCLTCRRATEMRKVPLSQEGTLYYYTVIHVGLEGFLSPYAVGWVTLPEGIRLFGPICAGEPNIPLRIGMPMKMTLHPLPAEDGSLEDGFAFQPIGETECAK